MFNEKIFLLLWFWFFAVGVCTGLDLLYWLITNFKSQRERRIKQYLNVYRQISDAPYDKRLVSQFTNDFLRPDGVLILRFMSSHIGDMISTELVSYLYRNFTTRKDISTSTGGQQRMLPMTTPSSKMSTPKYLEGLDPEKNGLIEGIYPVGKTVDGEGENLLPSAPPSHHMGNGTLPLRHGYPGPPPPILAPKPKTPQPA